MRRSFLVALVTVVGGVTAACSAKAARPHEARADPISASMPSGTSAAAEVVGAVADLPDGAPVEVTLPGSTTSGYLIRRGKRVLMRSATCTHQGCSVSWVAADELLRCPCHGATYDAWTGAVLGGPAPRPLPEIPIRVKSGEVFLA